MPVRHMFYCLSTVTYNIRLQKMIQCIGNVLWAHMDCIGTNTVSGGSTMSWFLQHSALIPKHQHQDEHRLSHRKSSALWENTWWQYEEVGGHRPLSNGTRCRLFHVLHVDLRGRQDLSSSPFCFSALQGSWTEQRLLALIWLPAQRQVLETSTHLCFQPSVCNSAIWWALDAQARLILWLRQNFF